MKVIHIIPSAFDYFNDIRSSAFSLVEAINVLGIQADAITVQYGSSIKKDVAAEIKAAAPTRPEGKLVLFEGVLSDLDNYDVVHLHCPMLGELNHILRWKRAHLGTPLVITYHRSVTVSDLFSWVAVWYNAYYLPKIFRLADVVTYPVDNKSLRRYEKKVPASSPQLVVDTSDSFAGNDLTDYADKVQLNPLERQAWKYATIYNQLIS